MALLANRRRRLRPWQGPPCREGRRQGGADLRTALEYTSDTRARLSLWLAMGSNRESNLKDDDAALAAYQQIVGSPRDKGRAEYYRGLQNAARILRKRGKVDQALTTLRQADIDGLRGYWRGAMLFILGETLAAAGRNEEALAACRALLADDSVEGSHRKTARERIEALGPTAADGPLPPRR